MYCDRCHVEFSAPCSCQVYDLEERVSFLEEELDKLTLIVKAISSHVMASNGGKDG